MIFLHSPFLIITLLLGIAVASKKCKAKFDCLYLCFCLVIAIWIVAEILPYMHFAAPWYRFLYITAFSSSWLIPSITFFLIVEFYGMWKKIPRWTWISTCVIAAVVIASGIINLNYGFYFDSLDFVEAPYYQVLAEKKPIYYLISTLSFYPAVLAVFFGIMRRVRLPKAYRSTIHMLLGVVLIFIAGWLIRASDVFEATDVDMALVGMCCANVLFYIAVMGKGRTSFLNVWQRDIFDFLDEIILISDSSGKVVNANAAAVKLFKETGVDPRNHSLEKGIEKLDDADSVSLRTLEDDNNKVISTDLYVTRGKYPDVYEVVESDVPRYLGVGTGKYWVLVQATRNRLAIERLRDIAGVDSLTGLYNRFGYEQILRKWDVKKNLPLSLIMGDVNNLKTLNDEYGHGIGDELLHRVAEVLRTCCPQNGAVARLGGDEFILVLKNHDENASKKVIEYIQSEVEKIRDFPCDISIALGSATQYTSEENINLLSARADAVMYANKIERRK